MTPLAKAIMAARAQRDMPRQRKLLKEIAEETERLEKERDRLRRDITSLQRECQRWQEERAMFRKAVTETDLGQIRVIQRIVCEETGLKHEELLSHRRTAGLVRARQVAFWLCKQCTPRSLPEIGSRFNDRDHTTVLHGVRKINALLAEDPDLAKLCCRLKARVETALQDAAKARATAFSSCQPQRTTDGRTNAQNN
jgi:chromosomal replication initiation ATPase DnaA